MQELPKGVRQTVDSICQELHSQMQELSAGGSTMVN